MDCSEEWSDDDAFLILAASMTADVDNQGADSEFNTSDNLPLSRHHGLSHEYDFNASDYLPLSQYRLQLCNDSSASDPTYQPENTLLLKKTQRKRSRKERYLHQAIAKSKAQADREASDQAVHKQRLDNLLSANGLRQVEVASDGNCFFESCALSLSITALDLRKCLCDYLEDNLGMFIDFMPFAEDGNERYMEYMQNILELRHPGRWSNRAGDMLPLALASWTGRNVRILQATQVSQSSMSIP